MIDEKKIEEVANKDSVFLYSEWNTPCKEAYVRGFKACMHWLRQSLWHDASERPPRYDTYLVRTKQGCLDFCHFATEKWHSKDIGTVEKWLDLSDIKPKGGEQCM